MQPDPSPASLSSPPLSALLAVVGTHAHCRGCKERINVSTPVAREGWHTVHACAPEHAIEVHVRSPGAEPWAWRYVADAIAADLPLAPGTPRRRGSLRG
jgi:hypothetical protein